MPWPGGYCVGDDDATNGLSWFETRGPAALLTMRFSDLILRSTRQRASRSMKPQELPCYSVIRSRRADHEGRRQAYQEHLARGGRPYRQRDRPAPAAAPFRGGG